MIRVPGKCIYLCSPRTASRATATALLRECEGQNLINGHHAMPSDMKKLNRYEEPVVCMVREPYDWILAQYSRHWFSRIPEKREPMRMWLSHFNADLIGFGNGRIHPYHEWVDECYLYEDGVEAFLSAMGFPEVVAPDIGRGTTQEYPIKRNSVHPDCRELIDKKYANDIALYNHWQERRHGLKQAI